MNASKIVRNLSSKLATAGVMATVSYADGIICVEAECDVTARDVLGFDSFTAYVEGYEVIIL